MLIVTNVCVASVAIRCGLCASHADHPVVNFTIHSGRSSSKSSVTAVSIGTVLSLRCEVRGFPYVGLKLAPPSRFNRTLAHCNEVERSWYSVVYTCLWTASLGDSGVFNCIGSIVMDSQSGENVTHSENASHQLSVHGKH